jgi:DNA helicase II / ATP-dependent DNA helicase PcrA
MSATPQFKLDPKFLRDALEILGTFNEEQIEAILGGSNTHISAVAGCGKTRTLSGAICAKILLGSPPENIGVTSYTTVAAEEIATRAEVLITKANAGVIPETTFARGTFHSIARQELIRATHPRARWKILSEDQSKDIWAQAASFCANKQGTGRIAGAARHVRKSGAIPETEGIPQEVTQESGEDPLVETASANDLLRNMGLSRQLARSILDAIWPTGLAIEGTDARVLVSQIERKYREIKELRELLDYTDLLELWLDQLETNPTQKDRWEHFLVDEFQDTNPIQLRILAKIQEHGAEIVTCGDTNQCIAGFNGSDPLAQEQFTREHNMSHRSLSTNYRSSPQILELANSVLTQGVLPPGQTEASVMLAGPNATNGPFPQLIQAPSGWTVETTLDTAALIYNMLLAEGVTRPQVAILYRDNNRGNQLEEAALKRTTQPNFPPVERRDRRKSEEIRKVESEIGRVLQWWCEPSGNKGKAILKAILASSWFPHTGEVKATTIANATRCEITGPESAWQALAKLIPNRITGHVGYLIQAWEQAKAQSLLDKSDQITCKAATVAFRQFMNDWRKHEKEMNSKFEDPNFAHHENFLLQIEQFGNEPVAGLIRSRALAEQSEAGRNSQEASYSGLILSTLHLAKGKEYDGVILHHVNPGVLPNTRAINDDGYNNIGVSGLRSLAKAAKSGEEVGFTHPQISEVLKMTIHAGNHRKIGSDISDPLEEERRLFYVGITRARRFLALVMEKPQQRNQKKNEIGLGSPNEEPVKQHPFIPMDQWVKIGGQNPEEKPREDPSLGI